MKEFLKLVHICQSYYQTSMGLVFLKHDVDSVYLIFVLPTTSRVMMICNIQWRKSIQLVIDLGWRSVEQRLKHSVLDRDERNSK